MGNTKTGANWLKGGLEAGWSLSHKTGTGQVLGSVQAGHHDPDRARRPQLCGGGG